jgi:hypothetical protein
MRAYRRTKVHLVGSPIDTKVMTERIPVVYSSTEVSGVAPWRATSSSVIISRWLTPHRHSAGTNVSPAASSHDCAEREPGPEIGE